MVNILETKKSDQKRKLIDLLQSVSIVFLLLINLFLIYNISTFLMPAFNETGITNQSDSIKSKILVEVLNGCGVNGIADRLTNYLRENSFDVVNIGNFRSFEIHKSIIIDRTGSIFKAKQVAAALGLDDKSIIRQINREYLLDVTLILGKDYSQLLPLKKRI